MSYGNDLFQIYASQKDDEERKISMFQVPEKYRLVTGRMASNSDYGNNGGFVVPSCIPRRNLVIITSDGGGWEHVSIHVEEGKKQRTPLWDEMCQAKDLFWGEEDVVMQLHPAKSDYVNNHPNVLHLWRPTNGMNIPLPPPIFVGIRDAGILKEG